MKYLSLVIAELKRKKLRTLFTMLSIFVAFLLFGILYSVDSAFNRGVALSGADRLMTTHKYSRTQLLPESYAARIKNISGVDSVVSATWFGGVYQDPKNFFPKFPVEPEVYMQMYPAFQLPPEQLTAWKETKTGVVVGRQIADRFFWEIGDRIPIQADIWPKSGDQGIWEFDIVGIYDGKNELTDTTQFLFRYDYFEENRTFSKGEVGWYVVRINDTNESDQIAAEIDRLFSNSPAETKTVTEEVFNKAFAKQFGDIGLIVRSVLGAVFFTILLVAGNTMAQSVRDRTNETGMLKIIGFSNGLLMCLVVAESLFLVLFPALLGVGFAYLLIDSMSKALQNFMPYLVVPSEIWPLTLALAVALSLLAGLPSAMSTTRLKITDALRRN